MESVNECSTNTIGNESEWSIYTKPLLNNVPQKTATNATEQDTVQIKMEIELKKGEKGLKYKPDLYGHLRLVTLNQSVPNCIALGSKYSDDTEDISTLNPFQRCSVSELPELYNSAFENILQQQNTKSSQVCKRQRTRENPIILAEKKREYRMRIKEENPSMWCAMKQKEACKKREQREEKRLILLEMQKRMQLISIPHSPEVENHKLHLEALKQKYPEIWKQLIEALSAAEHRNQDFNEKISKKHLSKPIKIYKDVVEAQKKYSYRQRMKLERPELYEQQKARDSYAKSVRRMLKRESSENNKYK